MAGALDRASRALTAAVAARAPWLVRLGATLTTARGFFLFLSLVVLVLFLIRALAFPGTGGDDGEQIIFAQYLAAGYFPRNPPLFAWLTIAAQYVFGVSVMAVASVKFLAIWGTSAVLFACGQRLYGDDAAAALAALTPLGAFLVFWDGVTGLSNSILVMLPCALTFYAFLRLYETPRAGWYLALGIFAGLGFLSKYGYGIFLASLLGAAAFDRTGRARIFRAESLIALAAAAAILAPYVLWFLGKWSVTMAKESTVGLLPGLGFLASAAIGASTPLWLLLPLFFPQAFRRVAGPPGDAGALRRILGRHLLAALALFAVVGAVSGLKARGYYMSVLVLLPLYVFARVRAPDWRTDAAALYAVVIAAIPMGAAVALAGQALLEPLWCRKCERQLPYDAWSRHLRTAGFTQGTIVADWWPYPLDGNFKVRFPQARVVTVKHPYAIPPAAETPGACLLVWGARQRGPTVIAFANERLGAGISVDTPVRAYAASIRFTDDRHIVLLYYLLVKDGAGSCR
jgi:4-amino-4-deoxy-L-arabinose transferase-like glycosyltransferase